MRVGISQAHFTTGEISPLLLGRTDIDKYFAGAASLVNFFVTPQGGLRRRTGTRFVYEAKDMTRKVRLQRFEFSTVQAYLLEFGHLYMRVYKDGGIVESSPGVPVEVTTPWEEDDLIDLSFTQSADVLFIAHKNYSTRKISRTAHASWSISELEFQDGPYISDNEVETTIIVSNIVDRETLKSTEADFVVGDVGRYVEYTVDGDPTVGKVISFVSDREVLIEPYQNVIAPLSEEVTFTNYVHPTVTISHNTFVRSNIGAYLRINYPVGTITWAKVLTYVGTARNQVTVDTALTMVVPAVGGTLTHHDRTITATLTAKDSLFVPTDVGRHYRLNFTSDQVWGIITGFTTDKKVDVSLKMPIPLNEDDASVYKDNLTTDDYRLGAWSDTTGWPACITFHEQRLTFARTRTEPQTIWMSRTSDYENFAPTEADSSVLDDNGITYTIDSNTVNAILWLQSSSVLLIGTTGSEWQLQSSSAADPVTPANVKMTQQTAFGTEQGVPSINAGGTVMFIQRGGNRLRELAFSFDTDAFQSTDLTIIGEHVLRQGGGVVYTAFQQEPNSYIWCALEDGTLACLTYVKEQDVFAWHRHVISGGSAGQQGTVESLAVVPTPSGEELYLLVNRDFDGVTKRYIEVLQADFNPRTSADKVGMWYLDSGVNYAGAASSVFTGAEHLANRVVTPLINGSVHPADTVSGAGELTLTTPGTSVIIGFPYTSTLITLPLEGVVDDGGSAQGHTKRIDKVVLRVLNSLGFSYGYDLEHMRTYSFRKHNGLMDTSPLLKTADVEIVFEEPYNLRSQVYIQQTQPYPLNILSYMPQVRTATR